MANPDLPRDEVAAALAARQELGKEFEPEIASALAERIEQIIDARVRAQPQEQPRRQERDESTFWLAISSLGMGIPITAIAGGVGGLPGILAVWIGIALINIAYMTRGRFH